MKRQTMMLTLLLLFSAVATMSGQTIDLYSSWWDGRIYYHLVADEDQHLQFEGCDEFGSTYGCEFTLDKTDKDGTYVLAARPADGLDLGWRGEVGARVSYVSARDEDYLVVHSKQTGDACFVLKLVHEDVERVAERQKWLEMMSFDYLYDDKVYTIEHLSRFSKAELRMMRNEIFARNGYRFESQELADYFAKKPWYHPVEDNRSIRLSAVEQLNVGLIKSEESVSDALRGGLDVDQSYYVAPNGDGVVMVNSTEEFIANLGSHRRILVPDDVKLDLQRVLSDDRTYSEIAALFRSAKRDGEEGTVWRSKDGVGNCCLLLRNISGLLINDMRHDYAYISGTVARISPDDDGISIFKMSDDAPMCYTFNGKLDGRINFSIAWENLGGTLVGGRLIYPNASAPAPILLAGYTYINDQDETMLILSEYAADGTITGSITMTTRYEAGELSVEGSWENPKTGKELTITCDADGISWGNPSVLPEWYGELVLTPDTPDRIGRYYSYKKWNYAAEDMMGGHFSFRGAGAAAVHFEAVNAPNNIAEARSDADRPAQLFKNQFDYTDTNECGYAFRATFYKEFVFIETTTSNPDIYDCFGAGTSLAGIYIKAKDIAAGESTADDAGKKYLEQFYANYIDDDCDFWEFVSQNITERARKTLADASPNNCPDGDCLAIFLFYNGGQVATGEYKNIYIIRKAADTYLVTLDFDDFSEISDTEDGDEYMLFHDGQLFRYSVVLGLVKDGDSFKVDVIGDHEGEFVSAVGGEE